jgi:hypothetical protein
MPVTDPSVDDLLFVSAHEEPFKIGRRAKGLQAYDFAKTDLSLLRQPTAKTEPDFILHKGTKLHFKSPTAERRHVLCVGVGGDRTHASRPGGAGYARLSPTRLGGTYNMVYDIVYGIGNI